VTETTVPRRLGLDEKTVKASVDNGGLLGKRRAETTRPKQLQGCKASDEVSAQPLILLDSSPVNSSC